MKLIPIRASILAGCIDGLVLIGWAIYSDGLKRILPRLAATNPLTAVAFISSGVSLLCLQSKRTQHRDLPGTGPAPP